MSKTKFKFEPVVLARSETHRLVQVGESDHAYSLERRATDACGGEIWIGQYIPENGDCTMVSTIVGLIRGAQPPPKVETHVCLNSEKSKVADMLLCAIGGACAALFGAGIVAFMMTYS